MTETEIISYVRPLVRQYFKDEEGKPLILTDWQCLLFDLIFRKPYPRVHFEGFTRWGKSMTIACALLLRITTYPERWAVAAGNDKQAGIIMSHVISHIFDHPYFYQKFVIAPGESWETIRRYKNKDRINFNLGDGLLGEVFITNAKGALGFGAPNVVGDESALTPDSEEALIARMLGDKTENFYMKVGNPWDSGHFDASREDPAYHKMIVDYKRGIVEGRITLEHVLEMMKKPFFGVLYECKRPPRDTMDEKGWMPLLTKEDVDKAVVRVADPMADEVSGMMFGANKLGGDVAGGGKNFSVILQRSTNLARVVLKNNDPDTMNYAEALINLRRKLGTRSQDISVDKVGVGKGVFDIAARELEGVQGVNAGSKLPKDSMDEQLFLNLRAAMYWREREWILKGGKLVAIEGEDLEDTWYQLSKIKYRKKLEGLRGKVQIMPKEDMLKLGIPSPDVADALALTFATPDSLGGGDDTSESDRLFDKYGLFPSVT